MTEPENAEYGLVVSFTDQSESFVNGFEAGSLWALMKAGDAADISKTTHLANREVITRMAAVEGWDLELKPTGIEGWDFMELKKKRSAPERPNPHGLRVV